MSSTTDQKIQQLANAQHRRLLAINEEIRKARKLHANEGHKTILTVLQAKRRQIDQAYSAALNLMKTPNGPVKDATYRLLDHTYKQG